MNETQAHGVAAHLRRAPNCKRVKPVKVTIGRQVFFGAVYVWKVSKSKHYYLLGPKPKLRRKSSAFVVDGEKNEFFLGGGYFADEPARHHPYGRWFGLQEWNKPYATQVDHNHRYWPWPRIKVTVEQLKKEQTDERRRSGQSPARGWSRGCGEGRHGGGRPPR